MRINGLHAGGGRRLRIAASAGLAGLLLGLTPGLDAVSVAADVDSPVEGAAGPLDEAAASAKAVRTGEEVEVGQLASPTTQVVALPDGGFRAHISALPSRVQDARGEWEPVDNTLIRTAAGEIRPKRPAAPMSFSAGGDHPLARIADEHRSLAVSWPGGNLPEPQLVGSAAHYRNVLPGVDLVAQAGPTGFSTFVVVETPEAARNPAVRELALDVQAEGVNVTDTATGGLEAKAGTETVFSAAQPLMWDSEGVTDRVERSFTLEEKAVDAALTPPLAAEPVEMPIQASNDEISFAVPEQVLDDPQTVYPVILDPGITTAGIEYGGWTMLWSNGTTMYNHPTEMARVGYDGWSGSPKKSRSFFHMDVPLNALEGSAIASATFTHRQIHSPQTTCGVNYGPAIQIHRTERFTASHTWSNQPAVLSSQSENAFGHGNEANCPGFSRQSFNVLSGVKDAVAEGKDLTLRMKSADETDRNGWRKYDNTQLGYPELSITYYKPPTPERLELLPSAASLASGTPFWTNSTTPTVRAFFKNDAAGGAAPVYPKFQILDLATGAAVWTPGLGASIPASGGTAQMAVTSGLVSGRKYRLLAWASVDSAGTKLSATAAELRFAVDTTAPSVTSAQPTSNADTLSITPELRTTVGGAAPAQLGARVEVVDALSGELIDEGVAEPTTTGPGDAVYEVSEDALLPGHLYKWRTQATDDWRASPMSEYHYFNTGRQMALEDMSVSAGADAAALQCASAEGTLVLNATQPRLRANIQDLDPVASPASTTFDVQVWAVNGEAPLVEGTSGAFLEGTGGFWDVPAAAGLALGKGYEWRVRPSNAAPGGAWSDFCQFIVDNRESTPPVLEEFSSTYEAPDGYIVDQHVTINEPTVSTMNTCVLAEGDTEASCLTPGADDSVTEDAGGPLVYDDSADEFSIFATELGNTNRAQWPTYCNQVLAEGNNWNFIDRHHACSRRKMTSTYFRGSGQQTQKFVAKGYVDTTLTLRGKSWFISSRVVFNSYSPGSPALPQGITAKPVCTNCTVTSREMQDKSAGRGVWWMHDDIRMSANVAAFSVRDFPSHMEYLMRVGTNVVPQKPAVFANPDSSRCDDKLRYANTRRSRAPGCVFTALNATWIISRSQFGDAARHVSDSLDAGLPGRQYGSYAAMLQRIRKDTQAQQDLETSKRRAVTCPRSLVNPNRPAPVNGVRWDCDEFPFASTYQGGRAAVRASDWCQMAGTGATPSVAGARSSRCYIPEPVNERAANALRQFLDSERVLDFEGYYLAFKK